MCKLPLYLHILNTFSIGLKLYREFGNVKIHLLCFCKTKYRMPLKWLSRVCKMDIEQDISITKPITTDILNDLSSHEAAGKRLKDRNLTIKNVRPYFKPWRIFINHIDSYHGKLLADVSIVLKTNLILTFFYIKLSKNLQTR